MYQFYVGSNNQTGLVDYEAIKQCLEDYEIKGYTILDADGFWEGRPERSAIVMVEGITKQLAATVCQALRARLHQFSVGLQKMPEIKFYTSKALEAATA